MPFEIVRNDIVKMDTDAIVNTANPMPVIGSGVDCGIHKAAGNELLRARQKIGAIAVGNAAITPGFLLPAKYVIHTVGPIWRDGLHEEEALLASCYRNSLHLALLNGCESIAFPLISTGNYGFPQALALQIAVREFSAFLMEHEMQIFLVVFVKESVVLSEKLFKSVSSYIDENYIREKTEEEYGSGRFRRRERLNTDDFVLSNEASAVSELQDMLPHSAAIVAAPERDNLSSLLKDLDAGFSETLLRFIEKTGKKDSEIYKKANVDRKLFSKIRSNPDYRPSKPTVIAFAIALELNLEETRDLLARAGFAMNHSNKFDIIIEYFIQQGNYDIFEINETLFAFDQSLLGE